MANVVIDQINERMTHLQDEIRQSEKIRDAAVADAEQKIAAKEKELRDCAEVLERFTSYVGAVKDPAPKKTAVKKTAAKKD